MPGILLYRGRSLLDGAPIICVATEGSKNVKTGPMVQTWILREDVSPLDSINSGADRSICGSCPHRKQHLGTCYVQVAWSPTAVWKAWKRGTYIDYNLSGRCRVSKIMRNVQAWVAGQPVRLGAYGDPAAVPEEVWRNLLYNARMWTGYTHQWRKSQFQYLKRWCMASVDTPYEAVEARERGWRTFRVRELTGEGRDYMMHKEVVCPASDEAGKKVTCEQCGYCSGTKGTGNGHVVINVHGSRKSMFLPGPVFSENHHHAFVNTMLGVDDD